jgi:predicted nucleic acid-binding protein
MSAEPRTFLDTNVLVYAFDDADRSKQQHAWSILEAAAEAGDFVISTQVLQEFYVIATRKIARPLPAADAERVVHRLTALPVVQVDPPLILAAVALSRRHQLSLWDALILRAAEESGCTRLLSEDLQDGFEIGGVRVENPFSGS